MTKPSRRVRVGDRVTIYPRGKAQVYVADFQQDGKHHRISLGTRNLKVATQKAVKFDAELTAGSFEPAPAPKSISQAVDDHHEFLELNNRARRTLVRYRGELKRFGEFLNSIQIARLDQIRPAHFDKFRLHCRAPKQGLKTMYHEAVVVKQWLKWRHRRRLVAVNVLADYQLTKPQLEPRDGPSLEQVNAILAAAQGRRKIQFATRSFTGMRSGELQRLRYEDVDLKTGWITIASREGAETKTRRSRKVPIHDRLRAILEDRPKTLRTWFFESQPSPATPKGATGSIPRSSMMTSSSF